MAPLIQDQKVFTGTLSMCSCIPKSLSSVPFELCKKKLTGGSSVSRQSGAHKKDRDIKKIVH